MPTTPEPARPTTTFSAYYGDGPSRLRLSVAGEGVEQASQLLPLLPPGTARVTDVDGARATFVDGGRDVPSTLSWQRGGLSFYLLGEGGQLSFKSFAGHVIYGAVAAYVFEKWNAGRM